MKISVDPGKNNKFNKRRAFNKTVGPGKNPKLINVGPTFIPDYRVREDYQFPIKATPCFDASDLQDFAFNIGKLEINKWK